jgi:hypothetical protein
LIYCIMARRFRKALVGLFKSWRCRRCCTCCRRAGEPKQNMPMPLKTPHFELSSFDSRRPSNCRYNWTITSFKSIRGESYQGKMEVCNTKSPWLEPCYLKLNFLCQLPPMPLKASHFELSSFDSRIKMSKWLSLQLNQRYIIL